MPTIQARIVEIHKEMKVVRQNLTNAEAGKWYGSRSEMNTCYGAIELGENRLDELETELDALHNFARASSNLSRYHQAGMTGDEELLSRFQHGDFS